MSKDSRRGLGSASPLRLKQVLFKKNLSEVELANKLDTTKQYINAIANGNANPTIGTLQKIAKALDVELIDLIEGKRTDSGTYYECPHCKRKLRIILEEVD